MVAWKDPRRLPESVAEFPAGDPPRMSLGAIRSEDMARHSVPAPAFIY